MDIDAIWRDNARELRARCLSWMGGCHDDAQEAFSRAWARAAATLIQPRRAPVDTHAWLLTLTYRICMDIHRERRRRAEEVLESGDGSLVPLPLITMRDPERTMLGRELRHSLRRWISELPPRLRGALYVYMMSGQYTDVATRFGITGANARKRVQQARAILKSRLGVHI